jgi:hypothetical protein
LEVSLEPDEIEDGGEEREFDIGIGEPEVEAEIEIADEDAEPEVTEPVAEAAEPPEEAAAPPRKNRLDDRLAALTRRAAEAEARADAAEQRRVELEANLVTERQAQIVQMESALKAEMQAAKRKLIDAKTVGDYGAEADATAEISKLAADLSAVESYRSTPQKTEQRQEQRQAPNIAPDTKAWIDANPWFTPGSSDHDEELAAEAQHYARKLEIKLKREGRASDIGNADYFAEIDTHMAKEFPDFFGEVPKPQRRANPPMKANNDVAPVARQSSSIQPTVKKNVIKLSAQERQLAEAISPNLPPQQAWAAFARNK